MESDIYSRQREEFIQVSSFRFWIPRWGVAQAALFTSFVQVTPPPKEKFRWGGGESGHVMICKAPVRSSGSSGRVEGGTRNMKSMRPPLEAIFITVRNVVAARLCFHRRLSFCSRGGGCIPACTGADTPCPQTDTPGTQTGQTPPPPWNAFLSWLIFSWPGGGGGMPPWPPWSATRWESSNARTEIIPESNCAVTQSLTGVPCWNAQFH